MTLSTPAKSQEISGNTDEVVKMEKVTITESQGRRDVEKAIKENSEAIEAERFKFYKGGLLKRTQIGSVQADLGLWPRLDIYTPGKTAPKAAPMLKMEVLHLRW